MPRLRLALVLGLLAAACAAPSDAGWQPPADGAAPPPETMFLALDQGDLAIADGLVDDVWPARGFAPAKLGWPLSWTEDPYGDDDFRFMFYSLQHTGHLLYAYRQTGADRYLDKLHALLRSFVAHDKVRASSPRTFDTPRATAYRAMVLVALLVRLGRIAKLPADLEAGLRGSLLRSASFLMDPARFEASAIHGFTEAAALLVVSHNLPDVPDPSAWRATALQRLETMRTQSIDADGVEVHNSPFDHLFVLGLVTQIGAWSAVHEPSIAAAWETTKRAMVHYVAYVTQPDGKLPALGATGTTTVATQDPLVYGPLSRIDPEFAWVWSRGKGGTAPTKRSELFPTAGLFVLRAPDVKSAHDTPATQTFVTFDAGVYRTSHSDLDALGTTIYSDGAALVPDAGLYTYDRGPDHDYFHGTRSHNTVVVDGLDQAVGAARPGAYGVTGTAAWATGQSALYDGVTHRRTVVLLDQGLVLVTDDLASDRVHDYRQTWHFFPGADLALDGPGGLDATVDNLNKVPIVLVRQADPEGLSVARSFGQSDPIQGWVSASYGKKDPVHALEYLRRDTRARFATLFVFGRRARSGTAARVRQSRDAATGDRFFDVCADQASTTVRIQNEGSAEAQVTTSAGGCAPPGE